MSKNTLIAVVLIIAIVCSGTSILYASNINKMRSTVEVSTIYEGISVMGVSLDNLTPEEARTKLVNNLQALIDTEKIIISHNDNDFELTFSDINVVYNFDEILKTAINYANEGDLDERYKKILELKDNPIDLNCEYTYNVKKIEDFVNTIALSIDAPAINSNMERINGSFTFYEGRDGYSLNVSETVEAIKTIVKSKKGAKIDAIIEETKQAITIDQLKQATTLIGSYETSFSPGVEGRDTNLKLGSKNISNTLVLPGDTYSVNVGLGPQTYAAGYRNAAVIVNGKIEEGIAGGVCQVSSTLYGAAIRAELEIVERANHSMPVSYVPLGQDAAIAGDWKDLKFKNDTSLPIYLEMYVNGSKIYANIYGEEIHARGRTLEFEKLVTGTIDKPAEKITLDPELEEGVRKVNSTGSVGQYVQTYKKIYQDGKLISRELFNSSTYVASADEVSLGTKIVESSNEEDEIIEEEVVVEASTTPEVPVVAPTNTTPEVPVVAPTNTTPEVPVVAPTNITPEVPVVAPTIVDIPNDLISPEPTISEGSVTGESEVSPNIFGGVNIAEPTVVPEPAVFHEPAIIPELTEAIN